MVGFDFWTVIVLICVVASDSTGVMFSLVTMLFVNFSSLSSRVSHIVQMTAFSKPKVSQIVCVCISIVNYKTQRGMP